MLHIGTAMNALSLHSTCTQLARSLACTLPQDNPSDAAAAWAKKERFAYFPDWFVSSFSKAGWTGRCGWVGQCLCCCVWAWEERGRARRGRVG